MEKFIQFIEDFCHKYYIQHRFVGSVSFGGLINNKTTWKINIEKREIFLKDHNSLALMRSDKTIKDIDLIIISRTKKSILEDFSEELKVKFSQEKLPFISLETAIFYPQTINTFLQFVTTIYVDKSNKAYLMLDSVKQKITWKSLEPWKVILEDKQTFTVRNPIADYFAYQIRNAGGIKPKDKNKLKLLKKLADNVIEKGKRNKIDYLSDSYYGTWQTYLIKLQTSHNIGLTLKRFLTKTYWRSVGTYFAHGKGIGKYTLFLSNKFTGAR